MAYKPEIHDAYLVLRLATSRGLDDEFDLRGPDYSLAKEVFDSYQTNGCAISQAGVSGISATSSAINVNSWFDSTRRLAREQHADHCKRSVFGYELTDGKSILYFKRLPRRIQTNRADSFDNIAGAIDPVASGKIREAYVYVVRGQTVTYADQEYPDGQTFTGLKGETEFEPADATSVFERTAIRSTPPPTGFTNEWLMFPTVFRLHRGNGRHQSFQAVELRRLFALNERCHFFSPSVRTHDDFDQIFRLRRQTNPATRGTNRMALCEKKTLINLPRLKRMSAVSFIHRVVYMNLMRRLKAPSNRSRTGKRSSK